MFYLLNVWLWASGCDCNLKFHILAPQTMMAHNSLISISENYKPAKVTLSSSQLFVTSPHTQLVCSCWYVVETKAPASNDWSIISFPYCISITVVWFTCFLCVFQEESFWEIYGGNFVYVKYFRVCKIFCTQVARLAVFSFCV